MESHADMLQPNTRTDDDTSLRVLFITPGPVPPSADPARNAVAFLSPRMHGDIVSTVWASSQADVRSMTEETRGGLGAFRYHALAINGISTLLRPLRALAFYVATGRALSRHEGPFDAIIAHGPNTTAIAALILSRLTGAAFIVDMHGHPYRGYTFQTGAVARVKEWIARRLVPFVLNRTQGIKLLYPTQLDDIDMSSAPYTEVFHDFTAVSRLRPGTRDDHYVLLLGYPWFLKGVDVLIRAFLAIADRHPTHRLLIVGHCPDRAPFEELAAGHPRIEFRPGIPSPEAMTLIESCTVLALPSRTEAMGRVILEAYAARKPVVGSNVEGIPHVVEDGVSGLLVTPGDADDLAAKLDLLLTDRALAERIAARGYEAATTRFSEAAYADRFYGFVSEVVRRRRDERGSASTAR
jgi:glycosyltransferase involved in cell wall biosynthesis